MTTHITPPWWETGVGYQIYPRSFQDSNADGIGDLPGLQARLPYLADLGVAALWLSPIYPSPMVDGGYDVSNYTDIHPLLGTMSDFLEFLAAVHRLGLKLILEFAPNHTSDQHPWFLESRAKQNNPKRDWYIWKNPKPDGSPPTNWQSYYGGSAWEWEPQTGQYYLHLFTKAQPDLNWRNPAVVQAMFAVLRFWLDRDVDGVRVDGIALLLKDANFRDEPALPNAVPTSAHDLSHRHTRTADQPEVHDLIRQMRRIIDEYGERVFIGELWPAYEKLATYYGKKSDECHLSLNVSLSDCPFTAPAIQKNIHEYETALPEDAWPNWALGKHDRDRIASAQRTGEKNARLAQMLLLTLRGTPTMYYGDELGLSEDALTVSPGHRRDPEQALMSWDASPHAGFSTVAPWLPVAPDYRARNVKAQETEPLSMLQMVKQIIRFRQTSPALNHGRSMSIPVFDRDVLAYLRTGGEESILVVLNFSPKEKVVNLAANSQKNQQILLSTRLDRTGEVSLNALKLRGHEGLLIRVAWF